MPGLLLPSGKSAPKPTSFVPHIHCAQCYKTSNTLSYLEATEDSLVACHTCGFVDERSTWAHSAVDASDPPRSKVIVSTDSNVVYNGLGGDPGVSFTEAWGSFETTLEKQFKDEVDALFRLYLEDPATCLFDSPNPSLVQPAKIWFLRIREKERERRARRYKETPDSKQIQATLAAHPGRRRTKYQVVIAIRFAAQDANLVHANSRLDRDDKQGVQDLIGKADERPFAFPLDQLWLRTRGGSDGSAGALDSLQYLYTINRRCCVLLGRSLSPVDGILCFLLQSVRRLQTLCEFSLAGHYDKFLTRPTSSGKGKNVRDWDASDFLWFREHNFDWERVLQAAYNLYRAQQCVSLWRKRPTIQMALCLAIFGCVALTGETMPQSTFFLQELCAYFNVESAAAFARTGELRKMLCAWSTSFGTNGIPRPQILCPISGGIGNGLTGWASDRRRPIPELEMGAYSAQVVHRHWQAIARARTKSTPMTSFQAELTRARVLVAQAGPRYRPGTAPKAPAIVKKKEDYRADYSKYVLNPANSSAANASNQIRPAASSGLRLRGVPSATSRSTPTMVVQPSPASTFSPALHPDTPLREISDLLPEQSVDGVPTRSLDGGDAGHIGILICERQFYVAYDDSFERRRGHLVSEDVEAAMNKWLTARRAEGSLPSWDAMDKAYLLSLGVRDTPLELRHPQGNDLGPWINRVKDRMSPTEALLRAGVRPLEFPLHYVVKSLDELHSQLDLSGLPGVRRPTSRPLTAAESSFLAPEGESIDENQLDVEMRLLWSEAVTSERLGQLFCSPEEVEERRATYEIMDAGGAVDEPSSRSSTDARARRLLRKLAAREDQELALMGEEEGVDQLVEMDQEEDIRLAVADLGMDMVDGQFNFGTWALDEEADGPEQDSEDESDEEGSDPESTPSTNNRARAPAPANGPRKRAAGGDASAHKKRARQL